MAARVCPECDRAFPERVIKCRWCERFTGFDPRREPDEDWDKPSTPPPPTGVPSTVIQPYRGIWVVHDEALSRFGYAVRAVGVIVKVLGATDDLYVELEAQLMVPTPEAEVKGWIVRRIEPAGAFDFATPEDIIGRAEA